MEPDNSARASATDAESRNPSAGRVAPALLAGLLLFAAPLTQAAEPSQAVHLRGATTLVPLLQTLAETYMRERPGTKIVIGGGGTARGHKAILNGTADVAMASGNLPEEPDSLNGQAAPRFLETTLGYDAIVCVVHPSNPISDLDLKQINRIFTGRINNWKTLGGHDMPIKVLLGPPTGGVTSTWKKLILADHDTVTPTASVLHTEARIARLANDPKAVTFFPITAARQSGLKILKLNGVLPSHAAVRDGSYSLRVPLKLVSTATPSAATRDFVAFAAKATQAIKADGVIALEAKE